MKPYAIEFREKIVKAYEQGNTSIRKVATRFDVSKAFVQKVLKHSSNDWPCSTEETGWKSQKCIKFTHGSIN
jgi:transposase